MTLIVLLFVAALAALALLLRVAETPWRRYWSERGTIIANAAINTFLQQSDGGSPETFTTVANVGTITGMSMSGQVVDVTSHSNTDAWRRKIVTLLNGGVVSFPCYFVPNDAGHQALQKIFVGRLQQDWRLSLPTTPTRTVYQFSGMISKFNMDFPVDGVIKAMVDIEVIGEPAIPGVTA